MIDTADTRLCPLFYVMSHFSVVSMAECVHLFLFFYFDTMGLIKKTKLIATGVVLILCTLKERREFLLPQLTLFDVIVLACTHTHTHTQNPWQDNLKST